MTQVQLFEDQLASLATETLKAEQSSSLTFLSTRGGNLTYRGDPVANNTLPCVILAAPIERLYYSTRYDPTKIVGPDCYAIGNPGSVIAPTANVPNKQADKCEGCPKNEWGSAPNGGKGKACRETRRLLLIPADAVSTPEAVQTAELAALRPPVTSLKNYTTYAQTIATSLKRPPLGVVTEVSVQPDPKTQFKVAFKMTKAIDDADVINALISRAKSEVDKAIATAGMVEQSETTTETAEKF